MVPSPTRPLRAWIVAASLTLSGAAIGPLATISTAEAQTDRAAAQALFDEAVALRDQGQIAQACAKFEESLRLDPGVGTRFNLADCMERDGRYATAWSHFLEVVAATEMAGQSDRADVARARAKKLEPKLSRLQLTPTSPVTGMAIKRNGIVVGQAQWDTAVPVDAGTYAIEATAPGKRPWTGTVTVEGEGNVVRFEVPALEDAPTPPAGAPPVSGMPVSGTAGRDDGVAGTTIAGITLASVGVVGLGVGTAFGIIAMGKKSDVDELCPDDTCATPEGITLNDEAKTAGNVSTAAFIAGGALVVGGLVLWLVPSSNDDVGARGPRRGVALAPYADAGLQLVGRW